MHPSLSSSPSFHARLFNVFGRRRTHNHLAFPQLLLHLLVFGAYLLTCFNVEHHVTKLVLKIFQLRFLIGAAFFQDLDLFLPAILQYTISGSFNYYSIFIHNSLKMLLIFKLRINLLRTLG